MAKRKHPTKVCSLCGDQIDVLWLERHTQGCRQRTPEQRAAAKVYRDRGREQWYKERAERIAATPASHPEYPTQNCPHCGDAIATRMLAHHETQCAKRSPEAREAAKTARLNSRKYNDRDVAVVAKKMGRALGSRNQHNNGRGRRLSATISVDWDTFRELVMQLAPSVNIDEVKLL